MSTFFHKIQKKLSDQTFKSVYKITLKNAKKNEKYLKNGKSISHLRDFKFEKKNSALIVSGGPSLRVINNIDLIKKYKDSFIIISTDGSLFYLLENNIIPDLIVSLDPHSTRIIRWFGDEKLSKKKLTEDNYFRSQDIDIKFKNEIIVNKKILKLTSKFGRRFNLALCTSAPENVVKRLIKIKSKIYWWNPFLDDVDKKKISYSEKLYNINKLPLINSGGNVGSACWMIAANVLNCKNIGMIGMDFSYYLDTNLKQTQYYGILKKNFGTKYINKFYKRIFNPYVKKYFYTDYVYNWYKDIFLEMINDSKNNTINCTEGGILFGKSIKNMKLKDFFKKYN